MIAPASTVQLTEPPAVDSRTRVLLLAVRQALLICLGAVEDYLQLERSVTPRHKR